MIQFPKVVERDVHLPEGFWLKEFNYPVVGKMNDWKALVNPDDDTVYCIVSRGYKLTKHEEVWEPIINSLVQKEHEFGKIEVNTMFPDGGAKMWTTVRFPDITYEVKVGDLLNPTVEFFNSYDLTWSIKAFLNAFRLKCLNGAKTLENLFRWRRTHIQDYHSTDVVDMVRNSFGGYERQVETWRRWTEIPVLPVAYEKVMESFNLSGRMSDEIGNVVEISSGLRLDDIKTLSLSTWDFFNILCQYFTHDVRNPVRRYDLYQRLGRAMN